MSLIVVLLGALLIGSALGVVIARNPIHSALFLVMNLVGVACVFGALGAHFLAMVQIIVYAGAIMVLVIFVLMLLNTKSEQRTLGTYVQFVAAGIASVIFISVVAKQVLLQWPVEVAPTTTLIGSVEAVGELLYTEYLLPFEAAGILLMAALVGAAMLAKTNYGKGGR